MKRTKAERLYDLFGGQRPLAKAINRDKANVSRWNSRGKRGHHGHVPPHNNMAVRDAARTHPMPDGYTRETFVLAVEGCLDPDICPACKRPLEPGMVLDKRALRRPE